MNVDDDTNGIDREAVRSASKLLLGAAALIFTLWLVSLLPGVDRLVPSTPVSFAALVGAVATIALVGLLLFAAPRLASLTRELLDGPERVVENLASVVFWLVVLATILIAHAGLSGLARPLLDGLVWVYDVAFLLVALPSVAFVTARLYASLDPGADLVADVVVGGSTEEGDG